MCFVNIPNFMKGFDFVFEVCTKTKPWVFQSQSHRDCDNILELLDMICVLHISSYICMYTPFILQTCRSNSWRLNGISWIWSPQTLRRPRWFPHHSLSWCFWYCKGKPTKQKWFLNNLAWWIIVLHRSIYDATLIQRLNFVDFVSF